MTQSCTDCVSMIQSDAFFVWEFNQESRLFFIGQHNHIDLLFYNSVYLQNQYSEETYFFISYIVHSYFLPFFGFRKLPYYICLDFTICQAIDIRVTEVYSYFTGYLKVHEFTCSRREAFYGLCVHIYLLGNYFSDEICLKLFCRMVRQDKSQILFSLSFWV